MQNVVNKIIEICKNKGITGKELGEKLGLKKTPITDWKSGKSKPTLEQIIKICEIFGASADDILDIEADSFNQELIKSYHDATPGTQECVRKLLDLPEPDEDTEAKSLNSKIG